MKPIVNLTWNQMTLRLVRKSYHTRVNSLFYARRNLRNLTKVQSNMKQKKIKLKYNSLNLYHQGLLVLWVVDLWRPNSLQMTVWIFSLLTHISKLHQSICWACLWARIRSKRKRRPKLNLKAISFIASSFPLNQTSNNIR